MSNTDHFADVLDSHVDGTDFGMLGGAGATEAFSVNDSGLSQEGPIIAFNCLTCGNAMQVIPTWQEVAIVRCRFSPRDDQTGQQWPLIQGNFVVPVHCRSCGKPCTQAKLSPDLANRFLQKAVSAGILTDQWVRDTCNFYVQRARAQGLR